MTLPPLRRAPQPEPVEDVTEAALNRLDRLVPPDSVQAAPSRGRRHSTPIRDRLMGENFGAAIED